MSATDEQAVAQFISITAANRSAALRFLDAAGGDAQEAIENYYADAGAGISSAPQPAAAPKAKPSVSKKGAAGGIRSLGDLQDEDDSSDDDKHNDYYVGGEKSGQLVRGAPKDSEGGGDAVEGLFENARRAGAVEGRPEDLHAGGSSGGGGGGFQSFKGRGRTLAGGDAAEEEDEEEEEAGPEERNITIAFYANGIFTVDDGEPRRMDDPANLPFMSAISRGQCPPELDPRDPAVHIRVNMVRHAGEYTPPAEAKFKAFAGSGHRLTDATTDTSAGASAAAVTVGPPASGGYIQWEGADQSKPKTSIQLRLADGSRVVAEFNLDHTVADIRRFIHAARPDMPAAFSLSTAFPKQQLGDDSATIEGAGLANSVVIQQLPRSREN